MNQKPTKNLPKIKKKIGHKISLQSAAHNCTTRFSEKTHLFATLNAADANAFVNFFFVSCVNGLAFHFNDDWPHLVFCCFAQFASKHEPILFHFYFTFICCWLMADGCCFLSAYARWCCCCCLCFCCQSISNLRCVNIFYSFQFIFILLMIPFCCCFYLLFLAFHSIYLIKCKQIGIQFFN